MHQECNIPAKQYYIGHLSKICLHMFVRVHTNPCPMVTYKAHSEVSSLITNGKPSRKQSLSNREKIN